MQFLKTAYTNLYNPLVKAKVEAVLATIADQDCAHINALGSKLKPTGLTRATVLVEKTDTPSCEDVLSELAKQFSATKTPK